MLQSGQRIGQVEKEYNERHRQNDKGEIRFKNLKNEQIRLTFTFKALSVETPQQTTTVVTECGALVVVVFEAMRHINLETLFLELKNTQKYINYTESWYLIIKENTNRTVCVSGFSLEFKVKFHNQNLSQCLQ